MAIVTTIIGILILAAAAILFVKFAKSTMVTLVTVAGLLIGLLLIFGPANIPGLSDYTNTKAIQDFIPGTGSAVYAPYQINITSMHTDSQGNLIIDVENIGDLPVIEFKVIINGEEVEIYPPVYSLNQEQTTSLNTVYKPITGDTIIVSAGGAEDNEKWV